MIYFDTLKKKVPSVVEWKNLTVEGGYRAKPIDADEMILWLEKYGLPFSDYITDTTRYLDNAVNEGKSVMFEAQLGALRDIDFGIYPYTSSSSTLASYAPIGAGIPSRKLDNVIGIMKAYSSCVGEGPFVSELFDRRRRPPEAGGSAPPREGPEGWGVLTCPPQNTGGFTGANKLPYQAGRASYLEKFRFCVAYDIDRKISDQFPTGEHCSGQNRCMSISTAGTAAFPPAAASRNCLRRQRNIYFSSRKKWDVI